MGEKKKKDTFSVIFVFFFRFHKASSTTQNHNNVKHIKQSKFNQKKKKTQGKATS